MEFTIEELKLILTILMNGNYRGDIIERIVELKKKIELQIKEGEK